MGQRNPNHQLIWLVYAIIYRLSTILLVVYRISLAHPQSEAQSLFRLGVMWPGVEPVEGQYNHTYLQAQEKHEPIKSVPRHVKG
jgi:hypothetical protein